jgi:hypothetical protein
VTFYTLFVIDLATRRVRVLGTTPHPDDAFMRQVVRTLTMADVNHYRMLICDRDAKWSAAVRELHRYFGDHTRSSDVSESPNTENAVGSSLRQSFNMTSMSGPGSFGPTKRSRWAITAGT